jgi:hypothetical protein
MNEETLVKERGEIEKEFDVLADKADQLTKVVEELNQVLANICSPEDDCADCAPVPELCVMADYIRGKHEQIGRATDRLRGIIRRVQL